MDSIKIKKLLDNAVIPAKQTPNSAGYDICSAVDMVIPSSCFCAVSTGIAIELPVGYEAQVRPRSGLAFKHGITVLNAPGTIDADYRGEIKVALINHGKADYEIKAGDRIAQLVFGKLCDVTLEESATLSDTERGEGGFGSTGR